MLLAHLNQIIVVDKMILYLHDFLKFFFYYNKNVHVLKTEFVLR